MTADKPVLLLTGADGFVGGSLVRHFQEAGWHVRRATRRKGGYAPNPDSFTGLELTSSEGWAAALAGVSTVVHAAARAHLPRHVQEQERELYWETNVEGTKRLAELAAQQGVRSFIFLSSIAVNGATSNNRQPFRESDLPSPQTIYGESKAAAEQALSAIARDTDLSVAVIRAPMIYGAAAPGSFAKLTRAVKMGLPLPFGAVQNKRAFLGIDNLSSFVAHCAKKLQPSDYRVFLVADDEQVSTADFITLIAEAMNKRPRLFWCPTALLHAGLSRLGLKDSLLGDLRMDTSKARATGWIPPYNMAAGIRRAIPPQSI